MGWTLRGVVIGTVGALGVMAVLAAIFAAEMRDGLSGLSPLDPISFFIGLLVMAAVVGLAAFLPARRALALTPLAALRRD